MANNINTPTDEMPEDQINDLLDELYQYQDENQDLIDELENALANGDFLE